MADGGKFDHKLCGFLCAVVSVDFHDLQPDSLLGSLCSPCNGDSGVGFISENGVIFPLIDSISKLKTRFTENGEIENHDVETASMDKELENSESSPKRRRFLEGDSSGKLRESQKSNKSGRGRKVTRSIGMVNGSISVVQQIQALVAQKCLKVEPRVVMVNKGDNGEVRAVLLVDVLVPVELWSGWQFPKCRNAAAALFKHLSCDWRLRNSIQCGSYWKEANGILKEIWNIPDCHVLGCNSYCHALDSPKRRVFKLHEIFKSLPSSSESNMMSDFYRVSSSVDSSESGIWNLSDDILISILRILNPKDLIRVSAVCRHLRSLTSLIVPCMELKLFPHQQAAVEWMLQREKKAQVFSHPLFKKIETEDGLCFYVNVVTGDIVSEAVPTVDDFRGGLFCDEPGLGKTITALSLILKTQGSIADPPDGLQVIWCMHNGDEKCAYYEYSSDQCTSNSMFAVKRLQVSSDAFSTSSTSSTLTGPDEGISESKNSNSDKIIETPVPACLESEGRRRRGKGDVRKNLLHAYDEALEGSSRLGDKQSSNRKKNGMTSGHKRKGPIDLDTQNETWVQCDACSKWRRIIDESVSVAEAAWFCSMNSDPEHQHCKDPEESWDGCSPIKYLQGFYAKGTNGEKHENVSYFTSVLRDHKSLINSMTKKALIWLAKLPLDKLSQMETVGLASPLLGSSLSKDVQGFQKIFQAFGLIKKDEKGVTKWYYPQFLDNLTFDLPALRVALCQRLDTFRLYLSKATLIVVPANLVDHWKTQIQKHVSPGQLRVLIWTDHKKLSVHSLAWDYDVVITTFSRLSAEWGPKKKSPLKQVHWFRVMLDEGHTLGSSLSLTNKFQMAVSLTACSRWILTGTPTPNTPNSQLNHLQPLLKFLHEKMYGDNLKLWEAGVLGPFEAGMEEGHSRLLQLLRRYMISSRKQDLLTIPPCIKKITYISFTQEHARCYNELVESVRRNILLADWNDPSHVESLLNPKQWKIRSGMIRNVRLSCCVAGHIKMIDTGQDIKETMDDLVEKGLSPSSNEYSLIRDDLFSGCNCQRCGEWCRLPIITPCRHLLCLECAALNSERCSFPGCGYSYEMQIPLARPENPNPKWPVPQDLIELQPSYKQDDWNSNWQSTSSSKVAYLVDKMRKLHESNERSISSFTQTNDNQVSLIRLVDKVLIFSQFLEHIFVIQQQLTIAGIKFAGMYSPMPSASKMKSLAMFQQDAECMVLLMDGSAALGLDLSFVTYVFLMEPIWDKSMEEQVISRAHRMGATRPINVETLAMRGTIEEQMLRFLENAQKHGGLVAEVHQKPESEARSYRTFHDFAESNYLAHLGFVRSDALAVA